MTIKKRNEILLSAGYASYRSYLASDLWKEIRRACFLLKGCKCSGCNKPATQVHHSSYTEENLLCVNLKSIEQTLFPVCKDCHHRCHFKEDKFRTIAQAGESIRGRFRSNKKKPTKRAMKLRRQMANSAIENERLLKAAMW